MPNNGTVIHWFRKGLRIRDNPALLAAIEEVNGECLELRPLFILDPGVVRKLQVGPSRCRFLQQALDDLDISLRAIGTRLYVVRGKPEEVFDRLFSQWTVKRLTFESDIEPCALEQDRLVVELARKVGVDVVQKVSLTLYDSETLITANLGDVPTTYTKFLSVIEQVGEPCRPCPAPTALPIACRPSKHGLSKEPLDVPSLSELGVTKTNVGPCMFPGGETEAMSRLAKNMESKKDTSPEPNSSSKSLEPSPTVLSPYLAFGCLSPRTIYYSLNEPITDVEDSSSSPITSQLMWREFYYLVGSSTPNFDKMDGNILCTQVPWADNKEFLNAWTWGQTGYPWIDAVMIQLRQEGWIPHFARHAVACFLTRGDLWISWQEGQKVFEKLLLDNEWALNAGYWLWQSASAFSRQFFRVYNPVIFPKKTDKTGEYAQKYIPALRKLPAEYVYEPWTAPEDVLEEAGCVLGIDYPNRIAIHEKVYKKNIKRMSAAYKARKPKKEKEIVRKRLAAEEDTTIKSKKTKTSTN